MKSCSAKLWSGATLVNFVFLSRWNAWFHLVFMVITGHIRELILLVWSATETQSQFDFQFQISPSNFQFQAKERKKNRHFIVPNASHISVHLFSFPASFFLSFGELVEYVYKILNWSSFPHRATNLSCGSNCELTCMLICGRKPEYLNKKKKNHEVKSSILQ